MKCPFCNSERGRTVEERVEDTMKRVAANDTEAMCQLGGYYKEGSNGLLQNQTKAMELFVRAANLGDKRAHNELGSIYHEEGNMKKAKFHFEAAAMAGHEVARNNLGNMEGKSGNMERAIKHLTIAASAGDARGMHQLRTLFERGTVSRESMDSTLAAYNSSSVEMRSGARDAAIHAIITGTM
jgi:TPR repeat protein